MDLSLINTSFKVSQFITASKVWDTTRLSLPVDSVHLQLILAIPIPANSIPDSICWGLSGNGQFSTKTAIWAAHGLDLVNPLVWEYNWIRKLDIMPKQKKFLWQICHASLPTKGTLVQRGMNIDSRRPFYQSETEDTNYLFLRSNISQDCWRLATSHNWVNTNLLFDPQIGQLQMLNAARAAGPALKMDRLVTLLWSI